MWFITIKSSSISNLPNKTSISEKSTISLFRRSEMLSPRFIPESVFYTQFVVHSPQSIFYTDRVWTERSLVPKCRWILAARDTRDEKRKSMATCKKKINVNNPRNFAVLWSGIWAEECLLIDFHWYGISKRPKNSGLDGTRALSSAMPVQCSTSLQLLHVVHVLSQLHTLRLQRLLP